MDESTGNKSAPVKDIRLLTVAGISLQPGGMSCGTCTAHLTIIDIPNEIAYIVPLQTENLQGLLGEGEFCLKATDTECPDEPTP